MFYKVLGGIFLMDLVRNFFFSFFMGFGFLLKSRVIVKLHFLFVALLRFWMNSLGPKMVIGKCFANNLCLF